MENISPFLFFLFHLKKVLQHSHCPWLCLFLLTVSHVQHFQTLKCVFNSFNTLRKFASMFSAAENAIKKMGCFLKPHLKSINKNKDLEW